MKIINYTFHVPVTSQSLITRETFPVTRARFYHKYCYRQFSRAAAATVVIVTVAAESSRGKENGFPELGAIISCLTTSRSTDV